MALVVKNNKIRVSGIVKQALAVSGNKRFQVLVIVSILFCIHRCAWIPEKIKRGFKKQERILFKIAIQSSSFGCIRDEDYHIDSLGRVQCIGNYRVRD
ncbi:unnamed protein product [Rhizophagus irregularis]|nr:unnamed protein product [Rhizophagus irregularis]